MKVVYLTWGETPRSYGVFGSHVVGQFAVIGKELPGSQLHFLSAVPLLNSGLVREKWRYLNEIRKIRQILGDISFSMLPIFAPQTFVHSGEKTFPFMHGMSHWHLAKRLKKLNPDIVHCRSFHATWAANRVRERHNLAYRVVFDGRGLWPEETAFKLGVDAKSSDYQFLKKIEMECISKSDASVTVSKPWQDMYVKMGAKNDKFICFGADNTLFRAAYRSKAKAPGGGMKFCYVGALAQDTWHHPSELLKLYNRLRTIIPRSKLTIVTTSNHDILRREFAAIPYDELEIISTHTSDELAGVLEKQDVGLVSHFIPTNENERKLTETAMAIKTIEYLAAGLPIICSVNCGGAAQLIEENGLGLVYNPDKMHELSPSSVSKFDYDTGIRCRDYARQNLTRERVAQQYAKLYRTLSPGETIER